MEEDKIESKISSLARDLPPSGIRKFFDLVIGCPDVVSLGVGEPDFVSPWSIREACIYSLEKGYTSYTSNRGMEPLRKKVCEYISSECGADYDPDKNILITIGASEALDLVCRTIISPGDEVIIPEPCFVSYKPDVILAGGVPVVIPTFEETGFKATPKDIEDKITPKTKAILLNYPNNPTGATLSEQDVLAISDVIKKRDLILITDEIYGPLSYASPHFSFLRVKGMKERTVLIHGFSKAFAMTGWRIGFAAGPTPIIEAMLKIHQYITMCVSIMAQFAAIEAISSCQKEVDNMRKEYDRRRRVILKGLSEAGLPAYEAQGAFYVFPSIKSTGLSSEQFALELFKKEKVAVVPGTAFGDCGEGHIRCSYASSLDTIYEALTRIKRFVQEKNKLST